MLYSGKVFALGQSDCIWAKWLYSGKNDCIQTKWLYSEKVFVFGQVIVFGQK